MDGEWTASGRQKRYIAVHWPAKFALGFGRPVNGIWTAIACRAVDGQWKKKRYIAAHVLRKKCADWRNACSGKHWHNADFLVTARTLGAVLQY